MYHPRERVYSEPGKNACAANPRPFANLVRHDRTLSRYIVAETEVLVHPCFQINTCTAVDPHLSARSHNCTMSVPALGGVLGNNVLQLFLLDVKAPPQRFWCFAGRRWSISSFSKTWFLPAENDLMFCNPGRLPSRLLSQLMRIVHWRNWKKGTV